MATVTYKVVCDEETKAAIEEQFNVKLERAFTYNKAASATYRATAQAKQTDLLNAARAGVDVDAIMAKRR